MYASTSRNCELAMDINSGVWDTMVVEDWCKDVHLTDPHETQRDMVQCVIDAVMTTKRVMDAQSQSRCHTRTYSDPDVSVWKDAWTAVMNDSKVRGWSDAETVWRIQNALMQSIHHSDVTCNHVGVACACIIKSGIELSSVWKMWVHKRAIDITWYAQKDMNAIAHEIAQSVGDDDQVEMYTPEYM